MLDAVDAGNEAQVVGAGEAAVKAARERERP